jgi:hypothetical protein
MWQKLAEEMNVPWRAAEAMHWQLGEDDMARRAGVPAFKFSNQNPPSTASSALQQAPPTRGPGHAHSHSYSHGSSSLAPSTFAPSAMSGPSSPYQRQGHAHSQPQSHPSQHSRPSQHTLTRSTRSIAARKESTQHSVPPPSSPADTLVHVHAGVRGPNGNNHPAGATSWNPANAASAGTYTSASGPYTSPTYSTTGTATGWTTTNRGNDREAWSSTQSQRLPSVVELTTRGSPYVSPSYMVTTRGSPYSAPAAPAYAVSYAPQGGMLPGPAMGYSTGAGVGVDVAGSVGRSGRVHRSSSRSPEKERGRGRARG